MKSQWIHTKWRPCMGWMYFVTCICDFILVPIGWTGVQVLTGMQPLQPWVPMTIQGGGLFHIAMGAIVGITAWSRGREKMLGVGTYNSPDYIPQPSRDRYRNSKVPQMVDEEM